MKSHKPGRGRGRALYEEIKARICEGTYAAGSALPSTRACAAERGISRTTVSAVYEQLNAEGFIETRPGAASRVAQGATPPHGGQSKSARIKTRPSAGTGQAIRLSAFGERVTRLRVPEVQEVPPELIDFAYGPLSARDFPTLRWARAARHVERERHGRLAYADPRGELSLRRALQAYLARARGLSCDVEQVVVANGSQQVLDLCARLLLDPGDAVVVENPGYRMAHRVFEAAGGRLHGIGVDQHGLKTEELTRHCARLAYVTPTHQFPLGAFLTMPRRHELLAWAADQDACIIEDDYDSEYRYAVRPEVTLQSLDDRGRVIYVGTFSKTLSPQLRLGYAVLPAGLVPAFAAAKQLADRHAPTAPQRTLARLLDDGSYERHVRRVRRLQQARQQALLSALDRHLAAKVTVHGAASGLHVVVWVNECPAEREPELVAAVRREHVLVHPLSPLYLDGTVERAGPRHAGLIMGYALLDAPQIERGVRRLAAAIRQLRLGT